MWHLLAPSLYLLLLLPERTLWILLSCLCTFSYFSRGIHRCCNNCSAFLCTGQGEFHDATKQILDYVVQQAGSIVDSLRNVSNILAVVKHTGVSQIFLWQNVQNNIDKVGTKISSAAETLESETEKNKKDIMIILSIVFGGIMSARFRDTFTVIHDERCPDVGRYSKWIYIGLALVSAAECSHSIVWVLYARQRCHRKYTKLLDATSGQESFAGKSHG